MHLLFTCTGSDASFMLVFMPRFLHLHYTLFILIFPSLKGNKSRLLSISQSKKTLPLDFLQAALERIL